MTISSESINIDGGKGNMVVGVRAWLCVEITCDLCAREVLHY